MTKNMSKFPLPVILSAAKDLFPVPAVSLEKKILRRCAPQDDKEREVLLRMTKKGKCSSG